MPVRETRELLYRAEKYVNIGLYHNYYINVGSKVYAYALSRPERKKETEHEPE